MGSETLILGLEGALNLGGRTYWEPSGRVRTANWLLDYAQQVTKDEDVIHTSVYRSKIHLKSCLHEITTATHRLTLR